MRYLLFIIAFNLFSFCSSEKTALIENDVFIAAGSGTTDSSGKFVLKDTSKAVRFTRDFWDYFIRTHPKSSSMLFIAPLDDTTNNYVSLDSNFTFYNVVHMDSFYFSKLLADSVGGKEKEGYFTGSFFIVPNDTTGFDSKAKRIEQKLNDYKVTSTVEKEFKQFKRILLSQDTSEHYIIVFKKNFADNIYRLYE